MDDHDPRRSSNYMVSEIKYYHSSNHSSGQKQGSSLKNHQSHQRYDQDRTKNSLNLKEAQRSPQMPSIQPNSHQKRYLHQQSYKLEASQDNSSRLKGKYFMGGMVKLSPRSQKMHKFKSNTIA